MMYQMWFKKIDIFLIQDCAFFLLIIITKKIKMLNIDYEIFFNIFGIF